MCKTLTRNIALHWVKIFRTNRVILNSIILDYNSFDHINVGLTIEYSAPYYISLIHYNKGHHILSLDQH